jgi:hypothetical protein
MKAFLPTVLALVAGIVLGAWQPRGELLSMRAELDELRSHGKHPCKGNAAEGIRTILRAEPPTGVGGADEPPGQDAAPVTGTVSVQVDGSTPPGDIPAAENMKGPGKDPEQTIEAMRTALDARRAQAMAALTEQADLGDEEQAAVGKIMDDMNAKLKAEVDRFADDAVKNGDVDRRDMMDFAAESLDIVIATDDAMRKTLSPEAYADADETAVDPLSYLSGDTLDSLSKLEGMPGLDEAR